ncbi:hypothetical protein [Pseudoalteromonas sp. S16_S37]|uniref:hypothetical protein n=1 Tax=Pseudoalteromonas sp. S16_S37 TaxID=2720228 RepID=UPI0016814A76|nr:hypothetical protein [Pseudoalteromonas sp. S16_S37]MBD1582815.1 hypothetical protein [Pseudoalteromonas sp. S16_S37]
MSKRNDAWCYSFDGENFTSGTFTSIESALQDARNKADDSAKVYLAPCETYDNSRFFPDADELINYMGNQADDVGGEYANDYPDVREEAENELTEKLHDLLNKWCDKHDVAPSFYGVGTAELYDLKTLQPVKSTA